MREMLPSSDRPSSPRTWWPAADVSLREMLPCSDGLAKELNAFLPGFENANPTQRMRMLVNRAVGPAAAGWLTKFLGSDVGEEGRPVGLSLDVATKAMKAGHKLAPSELLDYTMALGRPDGVTVN